MSKAKSKTKVIALSAVVVSSVALASYTVLSSAVNTNVDSSTALNLNIDKIDKDTVKISVSNISESITSLQLGLKIEGNARFSSEESINWLFNNRNDIQKNANISGNGEYLDIALVSNDELDKEGSTIDICEIDVSKVSEVRSSASNGYRIIPRTDGTSYAYVISTTNKSKSGNDFVNPSEELIRVNSEPTITLKEGEIEGATIKENVIEVTEGYDFELNYKLFVETADEDGDDVTVTYDGRIDTKVAGTYNLKLIATDSMGDKSEVDVIVKVLPEIITELPTIVGVKESHTMLAGDVYNPMEGISATDAKGKELEVVLSGDFNLDEAGEYTLIYTATDKWGNEAKKTTILTVIKDESPVITGVEDKTIEKNDPFNELDGVIVTDDNDKDIQSKLKVSGEVNNKVAGEYKLSYSVTDNAGNTTKAQRVITVKAKTIEAPVLNSAPTISGVSDKTIEVGDSFNPRAGVSANDKEDGDLTESIEIEGKVETSKPGKYDLVYSVTDRQGAKTTVSAIIAVVEKTIEAPVLNSVPTISGVSDKTIEVGDSFDPKSGVSANDKEDGDLTESIEIEGKVNTSKAGKYNLVYSVTDRQGAKTTVSATITVVEKQETPDEPNGSNKPVIPPSIEDVVDTELMEVVSGDGKEETPLVLELKEISIKKLNNFLNKLKEFNPTFEEIYTENNDTVFKIKLDSTNNSSIFKKLMNLFKSDNNEVYVELRVKNNYVDLVERIKEFAKESNTVVENTLPVIFASNITIKVGDSFDPMEGVTAEDKEDGNLTHKITVSGKVNTTKAGVYELTYSVEDSNNGKVKLVRTITVIEKNIDDVIKPDETPDNGENQGPNDETSDKTQGNEDNQNPSDEISDDKNNAMTNSIPTITLSDLVIQLGDDFDPMIGVKADDKEDGDITNKVVVEGNVDTFKVGEYKLTYSVTDSQNATAKIVRAIKVVENIEDYESPKTSDTSMVGYVSMAALAAGGLLIINRKKRK